MNYSEAIKKFNQLDEKNQKALLTAAHSLANLTRESFIVSLCNVMRIVEIKEDKPKEIV